MTLKIISTSSLRSALQPHSVMRSLMTSMLPFRAARWSGFAPPSCSSRCNVQLYMSICYSNNYRQYYNYTYKNTYMQCMQNRTKDIKENTYKTISRLRGKIRILWWTTSVEKNARWITKKARSHKLQLTTRATLQTGYSTVYLVYQHIKAHF